MSAMQTPASPMPASTAAPVATTRLMPSGSWLTQTWRLTRWFLYLSWRRLMGKILLAILLGLFALVVGFIVLAWTATSNDTARHGIAGVLTFPASLFVVATYTGFIGLILLSILAGAVCGGEYGFSTQRMMLARGSSRAQVIASQVAALALLALIVAGGMFVLSALLGVTLGPALGGTIPTITGQGWGEIVLYWLTTSFQLFAYMVVAFFVATLGRSTAAGIGFSLGYIVFEQIAGTIFALVGRLIAGNIGGFVQHIPDWFLSTTTATLSHAVSQSPLALTPSTGPAPISTTQALIVTIAYCVVLVGLGYILLSRRDVTD